MYITSIHRKNSVEAVFAIKANILSLVCTSHGAKMNLFMNSLIRITLSHLLLVNGLLIPGRYVEQVTSPDILPPDFKYPYLYVPTHLCSQTLCSQLLFPITLMYPHIYIFWRYFPIFSVSFEGFHSVLSWCGFNWCRIHGKNMQSFYLLLLQSSRANYQFLVCYWASSCFLMCWRIPNIAKKNRHQGALLDEYAAPGGAEDIWKNEM